MISFKIFKKAPVKSLLMTCLAFPLFVQADTDAEQSTQLVEHSSKAKTELIERLKPITHFSGRFTQKVFDADNNLLQQGSGTLSISKPNKIKWHTVEPEESLIVSNGESLWFFDPFIEQVTAYSLENAIANTPILLITNDDTALWDKYTVSKLDNRFNILSNDDDAQVKVLSLIFKGDAIANITIEDVTGQISNIYLSELKMEKQDQDLFEFVIPEGIELDDQR